MADALYFDTRRSSTIYGQTWDLGSILSETAWTCRFKINITSLDNSGDTCRTYFGLSNNTSATGATDGSNYFIGMGAVINPSDQTYYRLSVKGNSLDVGEQNQYALTATTLYVEIIRKSSTKYSVRWTTNSDYTGGTLQDDEDVGGDGGAGSIASMNLRYFWVSNMDLAGNPDCHIQGNMEYVQVWDGSTSTCSRAIDDNLATSWESSNEVNPNIYVDMNSASTTSNLALYPNAGTTETEIKIQSSTDAIAWTDERTITWSNLTEAAWNYIRFNIVSAQYWRIYGSSGNTSVLQIDEIKVLDSVSDADVRNLHGHIPISSSDTSLNNAGV
ncbi:MAG TPA: discoidin domain-containing protein [Rhodospirillales bacterium]|nr:discoidin domain-containing protein [Rhodospirillales bacterium]